LIIQEYKDSFKMKNSMLHKKNNHKRKTSVKSIILVMLSTIFTSIGQLLFKYSSKTFEFSLRGLILNYLLLLGFMTYGFGALLLLIALREGELSVVYPFFSLSFIWVSLLSLVILKESMNFGDWIGIMAIILGVIFISRGGK
ncbi:MAG: EamA family transporter, partial [Candidatus Woesearchaeota archaeon]